MEENGMKKLRMIQKAITANFQDNLKFENKKRKKSNFEENWLSLTTGSDRFRKKFKNVLIRRKMLTGSHEGTFFKCLSLLN